jgi:predicted MFS family arabinose efflux permease
MTYTAFGLLIYFTHDLRMAIIAALVWGWGGETLWATGPAQVVNVSDPKRYGSIAGLFQSATYSGQMLGLILLGYLISHESHHRGQILLALKQSGVRMPEEFRFGIWEHWLRPKLAIAS